MKALTIQKQAIAGTIESSDVQIIIDQNPGKGIEIELKSSLEKQYGRRIREVIEETLANLGVKEAKLVVEDRGALDCTIKARTIAVVHRSAGITENYDWEGIEAWNV
ncbi:citrate lyase acyl carrier protein [Schnuerera sp. xch1]|uniref:citrate lyase acyl carrier protein n=1 Tax=Schnuerera sp. xch1 TaxID=2874283 RepID=UPI001CC0DC2C|nr:citrate lyase acyl carrier protein [Schnuerera sp. xch1]MBZ2175046.1 citrate lyase acyl carrier protein [Schnuerera sp. xch1]